MHAPEPIATPAVRLAVTLRLVRPGRFARPGRRRIAALCAAATLVSAATAQPAATETGRSFTLHAARQLSRDDNLFRLPAGLDPALLLGPGGTRSERISTTSVALDGLWAQSRQQIRLDAEAATHRFDTYRLLDNTSGRVDLGWRFTAGARWSGHVGGQRRRTLASFANTSTLDKDLVATGAYEAGLRFALGSRWAATADVSRSETRHGSEARRPDDVDVERDRIGLEFRTPAGTTLAWRYAESHAAFAPDTTGLTAAASDYRERTAHFDLSHPLASTVALEITFGRVERAYPFADGLDFSGNVWNAALVWSPTVKTRIAVGRWRELRANLDADAQHFESDGASLTLGWAPIDSVTVTYEATSEDQRYLTALEEPGALPQRFDAPTTRALRFAWLPRERFALDLTLRNDTRDSNRQRFAYAAEQVSLGFDLSF